MKIRRTKTAKAGEEAIATIAKLKAIAFAPAAVETEQFAPLKNSDEIRNTNPLIGYDVSDTLNEVNSVLAFVTDGVMHDSPLDENKAGAETILRIVRHALEQQLEYLYKHSRQLPVQPPAREVPETA